VWEKLLEPPEILLRDLSVAAQLALTLARFLREDVSAL
jgi:hypothetical protein